MLRLKVSVPGTVLQLSKIFPHFFKENIEGLSGVKLKIPSINFHDERGCWTKIFLPLTSLGRKSWICAD